MLFGISVLLRRIRFPVRSIPVAVVISFPAKRGGIALAKRGGIAAESSDRRMQNFREGQVYLIVTSYSRENVQTCVAGRSRNVCGEAPRLMQERRIALSSGSAVAKAVQQEFGHQAKKPGSSPMRCPTREDLLTLDLSGSQSLPRHTLVTRLSDLSQAPSIYRKSNTERAVGALIKLEGQIRHKSKHSFRFLPHGSLTKKDALEDRAKNDVRPAELKICTLSCGRTQKYLLTLRRITAERKIFAHTGKTAPRAGESAPKSPDRPSEAKFEPFG